MFFKILQNRVI